MVSPGGTEPWATLREEEEAEAGRSGALNQAPKRRCRDLGAGQRNRGLKRWGGEQAYSPGTSGPGGSAGPTPQVGGAPSAPWPWAGRPPSTTAMLVLCPQRLGLRCPQRPILVEAALEHHQIAPSLRLPTYHAFQCVPKRISEATTGIRTRKPQRKLVKGNINVPTYFK